MHYGISYDIYQVTNLLQQLLICLSSNHLDHLLIYVPIRERENRQSLQMCYYRCSIHRLQIYMCTRVNSRALAPQTHIPDQYQLMRESRKNTEDVRIQTMPCIRCVPTDRSTRTLTHAYKIMHNAHWACPSASGTDYVVLHIGMQGKASFMLTARIDI